MPSIKGTLRAFDGEATWVISNENIGTLTLSKRFSNIGHRIWQF